MTLKVEVLSDGGIWVDPLELVFKWRKRGSIFSDFVFDKVFSLRCNLFSFESRAKPMQAAAVAGTRNQKVPKI